MKFAPFMLEGTGGSTWMTIGILVVMIALFYFLMIRPQKKQEKAATQMRNSLCVGDEVTTIGGIVGKIVSVREETVVVETTKDKTHIRFLRAAIRSVDVRAEDSVVPEKKPAEVTEKLPVKKNKTKKDTPVVVATEAPVEAVATAEDVVSPVEETTSETTTEIVEPTSDDANKNV